MIARPAAPMRSGIRAPLDSPSSTSGMPRFAATCFTCLIFFMLITADEAPSTVKSLDTSATSRPSMRPKPAILPSAGVLCFTSGRTLRAKRPDSMKLSLSSRQSMRSRAFSTPSALRLASFSGPPIAITSAVLSFKSFSRSSNAMDVGISAWLKTIARSPRKGEYYDELRTGPRALDLRTQHIPALVRVERRALVHHAPVVPHQQVADVPLLKPRELFACGMRPQSIEQRFALFERQPDNVAQRPSAQIERTAVRHRMADHDRMHRAGRFSRITHVLVTLAQLPGTVATRVVLDLPAFDRFPEIVGHGVVRVVHVEKTGFASALRHLERVQKRTGWRHFVVRHVGMPHGLTVSETSERLPLFDDVRHHCEVRIARNPRLALDVDRRFVELAETRAELEQLLLGELLVSEAQNVVSHPRVENFSERLVIERTRQIDAFDVRADMMRQRCDARFGLCGAFLDGERHAGSGENQEGEARILQSIINNLQI